jgi:hypothetical protein
MGQVKLGAEHKLKMHKARDAYWAKRKAEKAALAAALDEAKANEPSDLLANSDNGPAQIQPLPPGGRPVTKHLSAREKTQLRVDKKLDKLLDAQIDAATGLYYVTKDGKHVYKKAPETSTGQYLLNQLIGKPKESIEVKSVTLKLDL